MKIKTLVMATVTAASIGTICSVSTTKANADDVIPVYRLYNHYTGEHFYTKNQAEKQQLSSVGWNYEGIGWYSATKGSPVYRVYNPNSSGGDHYYTMSKYEAQSLVNKGWRWDDKGQPVFYSAGNSNLYVAYNPNANSGSHNYTSNTYEQNSLLSKGWIYGKIAWKTMGSIPVQPPKPAPTYQYAGVVYVDNVVRYKQNFGTPAGAQDYAISIVNSQEMINLGFDGHIVRWAVETVQVN